MYYITPQKVDIQLNIFSGRGLLYLQYSSFAPICRLQHPYTIYKSIIHLPNMGPFY